MKRINQYKKLFNVEQNIDLKELKKTYRTLIKEWHPDKFQEDDEKYKLAESKSSEIIDGFHFLTSIAPETKAANLEEYTQMIEASKIVDFSHKGQVLKIEFSSGDSYEYFGVNQKLFQKLVNSDIQMRFAKRNILHHFLYRKMKKAVVASA